MTDRAFEPDSPDPFAQIFSGKSGGETAPAPQPEEPDEDNPFAKIMPRAVAPPESKPETTATGAFARGAARGVAPAIGSLPAIGAGAEVGAALGPWGAVAGGLIGGLGGGYLLSKAQDWALKQLPETWQDALGQSERQQKLDEGEHPVASFLGGLAPYAVTMRPGAVPKAALPENATALQRILAHPATSRVFGGAAMGGIELGQEAYSGNVEWPKVAISTGFGVVFNRPTRIGETLTEWGAKPARAAMGRPGPVAAPVEAPAVEGAPQAAPGAPQAAPEAVTAEPTPPAQPVTADDFRKEISERTRTGRPYELPPTLAEAADAKVMGPGITEDVFQGAHAQDQSAALTAQEERRTEQATLQPQTPEPDIRAIARRMHPELFDRYNQLQTQVEEFRRAIDEARNPPDEALEAAKAKHDALLAQLETHVAERKGYAGGPEARRLRAQARDAQREYDKLNEKRTAFTEGRFEETPDVAAARQHMLATQFELRDLHPEIQAAYRRAADHLGTETVEPESVSSGIVPEVPSELSANEGAGAGEGVENERQPKLRLEAEAGTGGDGPVLPGPVGAHQPVAPIAAPSVPAVPPRPRTIDEQRTSIANDVTRQLIRTGRPAEEAEAAGHLIAARYVTRSALFKGALGTPEELYHHEGAEILAQGQRSKQPPGIKQPVAPRKVDESKLSLLQFLAHHGGLKETADLKHTLDKNPFVPGFGRIFRKGGMTEDRAREMASEAGYLVNNAERTGEQASLKELHAAIAEEAKGRKRYRLGHEPEAAPQEHPEEEHPEALEPEEREPETASPALSPLMTEEDARELEFFQGKERVTSAAVRTKDGKVFEGINHSDAFEKAVAAGYDFKSLAGEDGFVTSEGKYVDRKQARKVADQAEQIAVESENHKNYLMSHQVFDEYGKPFAREMAQAAFGKINLMEGRRPVITLMRDANASTFIHETGHDFLEQLMRDAEHEAAPEALKRDAKTTLDWLGAKSADSIKTAHHEKFARGFEQYLREGTAPSPGLASIFAKFKTWLTTIYQTLKGLGKPINEDIRQVFDRMLAEEPQRTVIAPDVEGAKSLADVHEADATHTEPHEAEGAQVRVDDERVRAYTDHPEIASAVEAEAARIAETAAAEAEGRQPGAGLEPSAVDHPGADDAGAGGLPEVQPGGGVADREAGSGGVRPQSGAQRAGEPSAGTKSAGLPGAEPGPGAGSKSQSVPPAPSPAAQFGTRESPFTDKAGNIRLDTLTTNADVADAIRTAASENADFVGDRRGVVTDGQVMELADALGMDFDKINKRQIGQAFNAEQVMAARKLLIESATNVSETMKKAASGTDEDVMAYAMAKDRHQMIQAQVAGITAEAGRALRAFRNIKGQENAQAVDQFIKGATGKTLFQLRMEARMGAQLDSPAKVSKYLQDAQKRSFPKMVLEYWINGLISGVATHTTYMVGNTILAIEKAGPETAAAAMLGAARRAMGREGETVRLGEVGAQFRGAVQGLPGALQAGLEAMQTGLTTLLPGEKARPLIPFSGDRNLTVAKNATNAPVTWTELGSDTFAAVRGLRDAILSGASLVKAGGEAGAPLFGFHYSPLGQTPDIAIRGVPMLPVGSAVRLPGRFIAAIHSFFRATNYSMAKATEAYRAASDEGLKGQAFDARVADLRQNPTEAMMERSRHEATELTLMGHGSQFVQALGKLTNTEIMGFPFLKFIDPFVHIAGNILDQSIVRRTPVGILAPEVRADLMGKNGTIAQDTAQARMLVGTALSITFGGLAAEGLASGSGPSDPRQSAMWRLAGNQAHSVRIGDIWYDIHRLGPIGMLAGVAADMYDVAHMAEKGEFLQAGSMLQHAFTQNILDESFMRGPAELIQALEDPGRYGEAYIRNFLGSFVPYSVGMAQMARAGDPYSRQVRTTMDAIKNKVPGLSETLWAKRDIWGEEMPNPEALAMKGLTAIYERQISHDPVNQAMLQLGIAPAKVERKIRNVELNDAQYDDFARLSGRMTKQRLDVIVKSPDYQTWPNHIRHDVISEVIRQSREAARGMTMMKYPQIVKDATEFRIKKRTDEPKGIE